MFKLAIATDSKLLVHQINQKSHTNLQSIDVKAKQVIWSPDNTTLLALSNQLIFIDETSTSIKMEQFHLTSSIATFGTKSGRYLYLVNETKVIVLDRKEKKIVEDLQVFYHD
jgi:hypothetical protein